MFQKTKIITVIFMILMIFSASCSDYQKLLKSSDYELKYEKAKEYYDKEDYAHAITLFEELLTVYKGTAKAEEIYYYYAYCNYGQEDYILAGHYFRSFVSTFPLSKHREEAEYLSAYCYYLDSPAPSLDQTYSMKAIEEMQAFINKHPDSDKINEANEIIDKLYAKLETKSFNSAKLYYNLGNYKAAIVALQISLKEYPDTKYREEIMFLILDSKYQLAANSIKSKETERYEAALSEYKEFIKHYPDSKWTKAAYKINTKSKEALKII